MSEEFFPGLKQFEAEQREKKDKTYNVRMLKKIIKWLNPEALSHLLVEAGDDFGLDWFNDTQHPPVLLNAKKLAGVTLAHLLSKNFLRGSVAQAYFEEYESYGAEHMKSQIGVVFPVDGSQWVITDSDLLDILATNYVARHANTEEAPSITIVRLDDFIDSWKRNGYVL